MLAGSVQFFKELFLMQGSRTLPFLVCFLPASLAINATGALVVDK
jgi:hypothetical protein